MKIIIWIFILLIFVSCRTSESTVYKPGKEFVYDLEISNGDNIINKTITLKIKNSPIYRSLLGQERIFWIYEGINKIEKTGVVDNANEFWLHPPRQSYMAFTEIPPFPAIKRNTGVGASSKITLTITKAELNNLSGKKLTKYTKVTEKSSLNILGHDSLEVFIIEGENQNYLEEIGQYKVKYYFNYTYGFVLWEYKKPNGELVTMKLKEVK